MRLLADLTRKVRDWPLPFRLAWQAWWLAALVVGVDVIFSLGLTRQLSSWVVAMFLLPFGLMIFLMLFDRLRRMTVAIVGAFSRG